MCKFKKLTLILLTMTMLFAQATSAHAFSSAVRFLSNRYTQMEQEGIELINYNDLTDDFILAAWNNHLALFVNPNSLAIKVRNQVTGYVWSSTLDQMEDHQLNETWQNFVHSAVTIDFVATGENPSRESLTDNMSATNLKLIEAGFQADIIFAASGVKMQLVVTIENSDLIVSILDETIYEPEGVQLIAVQLYPFLAATKEDHVPGYMFIPDGVGALLRYDAPGVVMDSPFRAMIYGDDLGIGTGTASSLNDPFTVRMPVYGMVHGNNQNAIFTIVENGDNYAEIMAHTAGLFTEFNWITTMFHYRQFYNQPTTRDETRGPSIQMLQDERNRFDIVMHHRILSDDQANYVGMALSYQQRLVRQGVLRSIAESVPMMRLEFLGAEMQEGLLWDTVVAMTPIEDIPAFVESLQAQGLSELLVVYKGWARGGISNSFPERARFERHLGNESDVNDTIDRLSEMGIPMYFHTDYTRVNRGINRLLGGPRLARQISTTSIPNHFLVPENALDQARNDVNQFAYYGIENFAIETTASYLYSTFNQGVSATRSENLAHVQALMYVLNEGDTRRTALYEPNAQLWGVMQHYLDIPLTTSGYLFATDTVPFLQIVLRGHVNYYAPVSNFSANSRQEILRLIDYGAYPSFLLTSQPSQLLVDTPSGHLFTSEFGVWEQAIVADYQMIAEALGEVGGERIIAREVLASGVVKVTYANNVQVIINYTQNMFDSDGVTVEAENFLVIGGE